MKKVIIVLLIILLLGGCSAPQKQAIPDDSTADTSVKTEITDSIPPFEKEPRDILPLPEEDVFVNNPMAFVDTLIDDYEILHFENFDTDFELQDIQVEENGDGNYLTGQTAGIMDTGTVKFNKPIDQFFDTPDNNYAVLVRFKSDAINRLNFQLDSRFGRIMLDFSEGKYPSIDLYGDTYGDLMLDDNWNDYIYQSGEWAYAFLTITNTGQKTCYIWREDNPQKFNYHIAFGHEDSDSTLNFSFQISEKDEAVTISDIWLFSYQRAKV